MTDAELNGMPWTLDLMTEAELRAWLASRKQTGAAIDIETCELGYWPAYDADPYNANPALSDEIKQIGTNRFVRSPESCGWVWEGDLPPASAIAMYARIKREWEAYTSPRH